MKKFSARDIFRTQDDNFNRDTGEQFDPSMLSGGEESTPPDDGGDSGSPNILDIIKDFPSKGGEPGEGSVGEELTPLEEPDLSGEGSGSEGISGKATYPSTLAAGTFSLPGTGTFRQYQSGAHKATKPVGFSNSVNDLIIKRLKANA